jgi:hypothetical protein
MADIRKVLSKCDIKRFGYIHENLRDVEKKKDYGILKITVDPQTANSMMSYAMGNKLSEAVIMFVVDPDEFNKAFEEVNKEDKQ